MPSTPEPLSAAAAEFGKRVRQHRQERGLTQEQLATRSGLHWTFVGQVERGRRNITLHNILKLATALGVDAGELVTGLPTPVEVRSV
jgi:transcriptional regulator with XRE-family HTH domain